MTFDPLIILFVESNRVVPEFWEKAIVLAVKHRKYGNCFEVEVTFHTLIHTEGVLKKKQQ